MTDDRILPLATHPPGRMLPIPERHAWQRWHRHLWSKWEDSAYQYLGAGTRRGALCEQTKTCSVCNKKKTRSV